MKPRIVTTLLPATQRRIDHYDRQIDSFGDTNYTWWLNLSECIYGDHPPPKFEEIAKDILYFEIYRREAINRWKRNWYQLQFRRKWSITNYETVTLI